MSWQSVVETRLEVGGLTDHAVSTRTPMPMRTHAVRVENGSPAAEAACGWELAGAAVEDRDWFSTPYVERCRDCAEALDAVKGPERRLHL
jgi:hypothetical protein